MNHNLTKIIIIGGKGGAIHIAESIIDAKERYGIAIDFLGWAIDDESLGSTINGFPVLCKPRELAWKYQDSDIKLIYTLYKPEEMKERVLLLSGYGIEAERFATFIHPSAYVARSAEIGKGNVILSNVTICSNTHIGNFNTIYPNSLIGHDSILKDNIFISASVIIGSNVLINSGAFFGINSTIIEDIEIGEYSFIGIGSNVLRSVGAEQMVFGNPAKPTYRVKK